MIALVTSSDTTRIAILCGIFAVVVIAVIVGADVATRWRAVRSGLRSLEGATTESRTQASLRRKDNDNAWARLAEMVERAGLDLTDTKDVRLRQRLVAAGFTSPSAPRVYTMVRLGMIFVLPALYLLIAFSQAEPPGFLTIYFVASFLGILGLYLPSLLVQARADRRKEEIVNGFPDCLDLLLVCIEAGLGIEAAMDRVGREMVKSHPRVAELLSVTVLQLRAGASRQEAFKKLADTAAVDEIRSFTTLLVQSDKLGTSMSSTLRVYAGEMREKRRMRAEEKAHRLPVLISIPLVVFMLPTMIGVLMLPAGIRMVKEIFPLMTGG